MRAAPLALQLSRPQAEFMASDAPTVVLQGGAGSGKTYVSALRRPMRCMANPGLKAMYASSSFPQLAQAFIPHFEDALQTLGLMQVVKWNRSENHIVFPNGSQLWLRSQDRPDSLFGADLGEADIDEAGLWKRRSWDIMQGRLRQPGFSHQLAVTYTPKGAWHWSCKDLAAGNPGVHVIRCASFDNPFIGADHVERMERAYGKGSPLYRQEVLGEFVAYEGLVYSMFNHAEHVMDVAPKRHEFWRVVGGIDWGVSSPGCMLVIGETPHGVAYVLDEVYGSGRVTSGHPGHDWLSVAAALDKKWNVQRWFADPEDKTAIENFRRARGRGELRGYVHKAVNDVVPGIHVVMGRLSSKRLLFVEDACPRTLEEVGQYHWAEASDGTAKQDQNPSKEFDHAMDALRYACMGIRKSSFTASEEAA
jgi:PBSX family phage terminase large subunit